jgi:hypothetical protein
MTICHKWNFLFKNLLRIYPFFIFYKDSFSKMPCFTHTVGAQSTGHVIQNFVYCRRNISAHRRPRNLRVFYRKTGRFKIIKYLNILYEMHLHWHIKKCEF